MTAPGTEFRLRESGGVTWIAARQLEAVPALRHAFTTRQGGGSAAPFASLNLGYATGDDRDVVEGNRNRCWSALALGGPPVIPRQVHGNDVLVVDAATLAAARSEPPEADTVMTALRGVPIAVLTADCPAVIICDTATPAIAVVHAGWRGMARAAVWKAVMSMFDAYGTRSEDCVAAIGPCIGPRCYEVGEDVRTAFVRGLPYGQDVLAPGAAEGKWLADLPEAGRRQMFDGRLSPSRVAVCPSCTHCEADRFFSVRRDGARTGRQAAVAVLAA